MKAVRYESYGGYDENKFVTVAPPVRGKDEVLVKMNIVGINPLDNTFRSGEHRASVAENLPRIGGQTGIGDVIESVSPAFPVGTRVIVAGGPFGRTVDGTWAEIMSVNTAYLHHPHPMSGDKDNAAFVAGAGYLTGYLSLTEFANFKPGQTVLAPGIGGAVGMESVQIAKRLGASMAISTASTTVKANQARAAGYEHVIDLSQEGLKDGVMRLTDGKGVDVVIDGIGGDVTSESLASLRFGGMLVSVGYAASKMTEINVTDLIWRGATVRGFIFNPAIFSAEVLAAASKTCAEYYAQGDLTPTIAKIFPLEDAAEAVRYLIEDRPFGRVLMQVSQ